MSRGITLLIGRLPTISGELAGLAASARRVISMMATRVCLLPPPLCPADGARVHVITQISPSALSLLTTLSGITLKTGAANDRGMIPEVSARRTGHSGSLSLGNWFDSEVLCLNLYKFKLCRFYSI